MEADAISVPRPDVTAHFDAVVQRSRDRSSQVVWFFGDTGQGKTHTLREYLDSRRGDCSVGYARCAAPVGNQSSSMLNPYQALKDVIEDLVAGQKDAQRSLNLVKNISLTILACIPFVGDVAYGIKEIRRDLSEYKRGERSVDLEKFVEEYFATLERLSQDTPVLIVLDDVQWADKQTVLALEHFFTQERWASARVVFFLAGRQSELHASPELSSFYTRCAQSPRVSDTVLPPFDSEQIRSFFLARFPDTSPDPVVLQWLSHKTGGNPFFLQSYIQHLLVEGLLHEDGTLRGELSAYKGLPAEIKVVTNWLMKVLSEDDLNMLLSASVLGYEFSLHELAHLLQRPPLELIRRLRRIRTLHNVCELVGYKLANGMESTVFRFSQHAIHTALYNELTAEEREALHRSTAQYLNRLRVSSAGDAESLSSLASALMLHARLGRQPDIEYESILLKARNTTETLDHDSVFEHLKSLSPMLGRSLDDMETMFERALALAPLHAGRTAATASNEAQDEELHASAFEPLQEFVPRVIAKIAVTRAGEALHLLEEYSARVRQQHGHVHPVLAVLRAMALVSQDGRRADLATALETAVHDNTQPAYQALARLVSVLLTPDMDTQTLLRELSAAAEYEGKFRDALQPLILHVIRERFSDKPEYAHVVRRLTELQPD